MSDTRRITSARPFTTAAQVAARMRETGITPDQLAGRAQVSYATVKYFGFLSHTPGTLARLSAALGWPPGHLRELWESRSHSDISP